MQIDLAPLLRFTAALMTSGALTGCGGEASPVGEPDTEGALYAVNVRVFSADFENPISYIALVDSLDEGTASLGDALELPGGGSLWGVSGSGDVYVVSAEELTVTKYQLTKSGKLLEVDRLGLGGIGITAVLAEAIAFDGLERGFLFDLGSAQAVELDLSLMEIVGTTDLSDLLLDSVDGTFLGEGGFRWHGDKLVGVVYGSSSTFDTVAATSKVGFFDPADSRLEVVEAPCGGLMYSVDAPNGDRYFSSDPWVAGVHALDMANAPAPCLARLPAGSDTFDPNPVELNAVTGGVTGGLVPGSDGYAYVRVLDEEVFPLTSETHYLEPFSAPAWRTVRIELSNPEHAEPMDRPHIAGGIKFAEAGGHVYQNESSQDFGATTLVRMTGDDAPRPGLEVPGVPWNVVRIR